MKTSLLVALMLLPGMTLITGCRTELPSPLIDLDDVLAVFNEDLGPEGAPVSRGELDEVFQNDAELLQTVLSDLAGSAST